MTTKILQSLFEDLDLSDKTVSSTNREEKSSCDEILSDIVANSLNINSEHKESSSNTITDDKCTIPANNVDINCKNAESCSCHIKRFYFIVVGMRFKDPRHYFSINDKIELQAEPNEHEKNNNGIAIKVVVNDRDVGYVSSKQIQKFKCCNKLKLEHRKVVLKENYKNSSKMFTYQLVS